MHSSKNLIDYNRLFKGGALQNDRGCQWHFQFFGRMLGPRVRLEAVEDCGGCCRYVIEA